MYLIADSGSTKTEWCLVLNHGETETCFTSGINPFFHSVSQIVEILKNEFTLHWQVDAIYFYGAGCANEEKNRLVYAALDEYFETSEIIIDSDLAAAAYSLCQNQAGIAAILGTGSNSCFYNGKKITENVSPLGYILGDEGSGAVIGKRLIADVLKKQLPQDVIQLFWETYPETQSQILDNVYKKPLPNRYLAQFTKFIYNNINNLHLQQLVIDCFDAFIKRNLLQYANASQFPVHFTGSIAVYFNQQLQTALENNGLKMGYFCLSPMKGLLMYHAQKGK